MVNFGRSKSLLFTPPGNVRKVIKNTGFISFRSSHRHTALWSSRHYLQQRPGTEVAQEEASSLKKQLGAGSLPPPPTPRSCCAHI